MDFPTVEPWKLLTLMIAGGVFSVSGLWLMFRVQSSGETAKVELFGLKFQSSSAGLFVFLIGATFLLLPLFVPERVSKVEEGVSIKSDLTSVEKLAGNISGNMAVVLPASAGAAEQENNNFVTKANQIETNIFYKGETNPGRNDIEDWYVLQTTNFKNKDLEIQIRNRGARSSMCKVAVLDGNETALTEQRFPKPGTSKHIKVFVGESDRIFIRAGDIEYGYACKYELRAN